MLNCVIYAVTEDGYHYLADKSVKMKKQLNTVGIKFLIVDIEKLPSEKAGMLIVSDSPEVVRKMTEDGFYVAGFYHPKNENRIFEGASYAVTDVEELTANSYEEVYRRLAQIPWDILETKRLYVRESKVEDVEAFYRIYGEPSMTAYIEDLFQNPKEEKVYMEDYIRHMYGFYGFGMWTVIEKFQNRIIGRAGLDVREGYDLPELGFVIEKAYQRKGYAEEVCRAILLYAKETLLFEKTQALVEADNTASMELLCKLGFVQRGEVIEAGKTYCFMIKEL